MVDQATSVIKRQDIKCARSEEIGALIEEVYVALQEKGYNPVAQLVGYLMCGDPTYITAHNKARAKITKFTQDELMEEIVRFFLKEGLPGKNGTE